MKSIHRSTVRRESHCLSITPNGAYAYEVIRNVYKVYVIEIATNTVYTSISFPTSYLPETIAITPDGAYVYVTLAGSGDKAAVIETANNSLVTYISVGCGLGIAFTPDGKVCLCG